MHTLDKKQAQTLLATKSTKELLIEAKVIYLNGDHDIVFTADGVALLCSLFIKHNEAIVRNAAINILLKGYGNEKSE